MAPVILGTDFLCWNTLVLDFTSQPLSVYHSKAAGTSPNVRNKICTVGTAESTTADVIDKCAIPLPTGNNGEYEFPDDCSNSLAPIIRYNKD